MPFFFKKIARIFFSKLLAIFFYIQNAIFRRDRLAFFFICHDLQKCYFLSVLVQIGKKIGQFCEFKRLVLCIFLENVTDFSNVVKILSNFDQMWHLSIILKEYNVSSLHIILLVECNTISYNMVTNPLVNSNIDSLIKYRYLRWRNNWRRSQCHDEGGRYQLWRKNRLQWYFLS